MRVGLRSVRTMSGELFVIMDGVLQMLRLYADNLAMTQSVGYQFFYGLKYQVEVYKTL